MNLLLFDSEIKCLTLIIYYPKIIKFRINIYHSLYRYTIHVNIIDLQSCKTYCLIMCVIFLTIIICTQCASLNIIINVCFSQTRH